MSRQCRGPVPDRIVACSRPCRALYRDTKPCCSLSSVASCHDTNIVSQHKPLPHAVSRVCRACRSAPAPCRQKLRHARQALLPKDYYLIPNNNAKNLFVGQTTYTNLWLSPKDYYLIPSNMSCNLFVVFLFYCTDLKSVFLRGNHFLFGF